VSDAQDAQDALTLLAGATLLAVGVTDLHLRYVRAEMQPLLVLAGAVLVGLGMRGLLRVLRDVRAERSGAPATAGLGHEAHPVTPSSWLIALPLVVLTLVAPPSLGSYAAARSDTRIAEPTVELPSLPAAREGAVDLTLTDYYTRVLYEPQSLEGSRIRLTGFVTPLGDRWFVTRMALSCCAADGRPVKVLTTGEQAVAVPPADQWVEVVGQVVEPERLDGNPLALATLQVDQIRTVEAPADPYE
jgi:uncharacterized repeat protein (TIGR03943 family)